MRAVIQRVSHANVSINGKLIGGIGKGLMVLVGIVEEDTIEDIRWLSAKLIRLRIFNDPKGVMNLSVSDISGEILIVSQFTLFASTRKGNRPSYLRSAGRETALPLYEKLLEQIERGLGRPVSAGIFGADMQVSLVNDGPVTILLDSKNPE